MTLTTYIKMRTPELVAKNLGIVPRTVCYWQTLSHTPRPEQAHKLIKLSGGKLTWESIYSPYFSKKK